jgi:hypothetical protein
VRRAVSGLRLPGDRNRTPLGDRPGFDAIFPLEALDSLLPSCDVVVVTVPLDKETTRLLDAGRFGRMKSSSVLVSLSRGLVVDEGALSNACRKGGCWARCWMSSRRSPCADSPPLGHGKRDPHPAQSFVGEHNSDRLCDLFCRNLRSFVR